MARMRGTAAVAAAAVALMATGCGNIVLTIGGNGAGSPVALQGSLRHELLGAIGTVAHQSYDFTMNSSMSGMSGAMQSQLGSSFGVDATGEYSASQDAMRMTESVSALSGLLGSTGGGSSSPGASATVLVFLKSAEMYISMQGIPGANLPPGVKWVEVNNGLLSSLSRADPADYLNAVAPFVESVKTVGPAVVDGVQTTELAVTENLREMTAKLYGSTLPGLEKLLGSSLPSSVASMLGPLMRTAVNALPATVVDQVWLDAQGRLRRLQVSMPVGQILESVVSQLFATVGSIGGSSGALGSSGQAALQQIAQMFANMTMTMEMTLSGYGTTVDIARPPASEVQSLSSITGQTGG